MFTTACFSWVVPSRRRPAARRPWPAAPAAPVIDDGAAVDDGDPPGGCGWYESSHELRRGIELVEVDWHDGLPMPAGAAAESA